MSNKLAKPKAGPSVQQYLDIAEIKENSVVLKDGSMRAVLAVASVNFALKSEDEQNAAISAYVQFLNNLDHSLQIVIQSRKLNIDGYLTRLKDAYKEQTNELLKMQMNEYTAFIKEMVELGEIMSKRFYVVVPYSVTSDNQKSFFARLGSVLSPLSAISLKGERFQRHLQALGQRVSHVQNGLSSIGLKSQQLDTQALIELYYGTYNPDIAMTEKVEDITKIRTEETMST